MLLGSSSRILLLVFSVTWGAEGASQTTLSPNIVSIEQGDIQGLRITDSYFDFNYDSFLGIPFAKPPVGDLTFKGPQPASEWNAIYNATKEKSKCPQVNLYFGGWYQGDLDCLYLNVYVPNDEPNSPLPVMIWFYGGAFMSGSSSPESFGPEYLIQKGVIMVSVSYRLGPYGFMGLNSADYPGNAGLKDQRLAIEWVYNNIAAFGGDPESITIFGESAGGASVHFHLLSHDSRRYKRAISGSGSVLDPWTFSFDMRDRTLKFAQLVDCSLPTDDEIVECLQQRSVQTLLNAQRELVAAQAFDMSPQIDLFFKPTSEPANAPDLFYSGDPDQSLTSGNYYQVPFLTGVNSAEALDLILVFWNKNLEINENFTRIFPQRTLERFTDLGLDVEEISKNTKKFYFDNIPVNILNIQDLVHCISDIYWLEGAWTAFERMSLANPSINNYFYEFSFSGLLSNIKVPLDGVPHGDELAYLFYKDTIITYLTSAISFEKDVINEVTTRWTNFAKTGNPGGKWQATPPETIKYYNVRKTLLESSHMESSSNDLGKRIQFWKTQLKLA